MRFEKITTWLMHFYWRFARPMTLGVRAIVENDRKEVFLVKHTYVGGWHLPGGGVETGESVYDAVKKELLEEANIAINSRPLLLAIYKNRLASKRDHVVLFQVDDFQQISLPEPNEEIADAGWFPLHMLPTDATPATSRRVKEYLEGVSYDHYW